MFKIKLKVSDLEKEIDIDLESPEVHRNNVLSWLENAISAAVFSVDATLPKKYVYINSYQQSSYGEKINCIKAVREITGCGLYESKKLVESNATLFKCKAYQAEQLLTFLKTHISSYDFSISPIRMPNSWNIDYRSSFMKASLKTEEIEEGVLMPGEQFLVRHGIPL